MTPVIERIKKKPWVVKTACYIKDNANTFRVFGIFFFILTVILGVCWMGGLDIESVAFFSSIVSTTCFGLPSVATYIVPDQKPIRYMSFDEYLQFVVSSSTEHWEIINLGWTQEAFLKEDPRLRFRVRFDDEGRHVKDFQAPWANNLPDKTAHSYWYSLTYDGALINRYVLISVDGGRAHLPLPKGNTNLVSPLAYKVAQLFDDLGTLEKYMQQCDLTVAEDVTSNTQ